VTDIDVFVCRSERNAERKAVGLALMRRRVKAGTLKVGWMCEEEKRAYRLREPAVPSVVERGAVGGC
jgi:phage baseplate assembly protein gpV